MGVKRLEPQFNHRFSKSSQQTNVDQKTGYKQLSMQCVNKELTSRENGKKSQNCT